MVRFDMWATFGLAKIRSVSVGDSQPITVYSGTLLKESYYLFTATICVGFFLRDSASRNTLISSVAPSKMHASFFNPAGHKSVVFKWPGPSSTLSKFGWRFTWMNNTFVYSTRSKTPLFPRSLDFVKRALFLQVFSRLINCLLPISSWPLGPSSLLLDMFSRWTEPEYRFSSLYFLVLLHAVQL